MVDSMKTPNNQETSVDVTLPDNSPKPEARMDWQSIKVGDVLLGTYRVESDENVGKSGGGDVRRVRHQGWDAEMAMKRLKPERFGDERSAENFIEEYKAWIHLGLHPNIVACYYVRKIDDGTAAIFSEWMDNGSLHDRIYHGDSLYQGTPEEVKARLLDIAIQFARGLRYAHEAGSVPLIHQDVKPSNLMLSKTWEAKVTDFGIARFFPEFDAPPVASEQSRDASDTEKPKFVAQDTATTYAGTPPYQSPEQMRREPLSRQSDIYSWALSVLEMYGRGRWWNPDLSFEDAQQWKGFPERQAALMPDSLRTLLTQCLAPAPAQRPRSFAAVLEGLKKIYRGETGREYPRPEPKASPDTSEALNNRALSYNDLNMLRDAEEMWKRSLEANPGNFYALYNRALFHLRHGGLSMDDLTAFERNWGYLHANPEMYRLYALLLLEYGERESAQGMATSLERDLEKLDTTPESAAVIRNVVESIRSALEVPDYKGTYQLSRAQNLTDRDTLEKMYAEKAWEILRFIQRGDFPEAASRMNLTRLDPAYEGCINRPDWIALNEKLREKCYPLVLLSCPASFRIPDVKEDTPISFSADSRLFLCGNRLYDMESGELISDNRLFSGGLREETSCVLSALSSDGEFYLRALRGSVAFQKIEARTGRVIAEYNDHPAPVSALLISDDLNQFASVDEAGNIHIWDAESNTVMLGYVLHGACGGNAVKKIQWSYDHECLLLQTGFNLFLFNLASGKMRGLYEYTGYFDFCANSQFFEIVICSGSGGASLYNLQIDKETKYPQYEEEEAMNIRTASFLSDDQMILLADNTHINCYCHRIRTGTLYFADNISKIANSRNGKHIAVVAGGQAEICRCVYAYGALADNPSDTMKARRKIAASLGKLASEESVLFHMKFYEHTYLDNPNPLFNSLASYAYVVSYANPTINQRALLDTLLMSLRERGYGFTLSENALTALEDVRKLQIAIELRRSRFGMSGADRWSEAFGNEKSEFRGNLTWMLPSESRSQQNDTKQASEATTSPPDNVPSENVRTIGHFLFMLGVLLIFRGLILGLNRMFGWVPLSGAQETVVSVLYFAFSICAAAVYARLKRKEDTNGKSGIH